MVSGQRSPASSSPGMIHEFLISDSRAVQSKFTDGYCSNSQMDAYRGALPSIRSLGERISGSFNLVPGSEHERELMKNSLGGAHGLSLSLGSHLFSPEAQYRHIGNSFMGEQIPFTQNPPMAYCVGRSKYLKPVQCLLQEVVSVNGKSLDVSMVGKLLWGQRGAASSELKHELYNRGILPPEDNELGVRIAKLLTLLEELENRYERYYRQMEDIVSNFEEMAGEGTALLYTSQALEAMTRHFCCLSDGIVSQINATERKLKLDNPKKTQHSRVLLQQLGFLQGQRNAWRPIRGLPEASVAILRAWLFEHFLHPYPNDPEKLMLASQTGLSKNQVSNWFINARVRLWKPMIEEMYKEEIAGSPDHSNFHPVGLQPAG